MLDFQTCISGRRPHAEGKENKNYIKIPIGHVWPYGWPTGQYVWQALKNYIETWFAEEILNGKLHFLCSETSPLVCNYVKINRQPQMLFKIFIWKWWSSLLFKTFLHFFHSRNIDWKWFINVIEFVTKTELLLNGLYLVILSEIV